MLTNLLVEEGLVLRGVRLRLGPLGGQRGHEVRVGGELGGVLRELHPRLGLPPLCQVVRELSALVVEEDEERGEEDDHDEDDDDDGLGTGGGAQVLGNNVGHPVRLCQAVLVDVVTTVLH